MKPQWLMVGVIITPVFCFIATRGPTAALIIKLAFWTDDRIS
jgi:hypothetical protein